MVNLAEYEEMGAMGKGLADYAIGATFGVAAATNNRTDAEAVLEAVKKAAEQTSSKSWRTFYKKHITRLEYNMKVYFA